MPSLNHLNDTNIIYRPNFYKIIEAITYILNKKDEQKNIFILKSLYYSDKFNLQKFAKPITGDTYYKLKFGPVGTFAYDILKNNEITIPDDVLLASSDGFDRIFDDRHFIYKAKRRANLDYFSKNDLECLNEGIDFCIEKSQSDSFFSGDDFTLSNESHKEKAWKNAKLGYPVKYEDIIDENTLNRDLIIKHIKNTSGFICL